jgi:multidrug efflux pump subunit AcrA (membrane-fusion protein)
MGTEKRRGWLVRAVWLAAIVTVLAGAVAAVSRSTTPAAATKPAPDAQPVTVTVEPVRHASVRRTVTVVGSLFGQEEITLSPKVDGRVARVCHDVGERVKPGELMLEIDPIDYRLAAAEAERALELELARLGLKELPEQDFDVRRLPTVERAASLERNAGTRRDRSMRLGTATATEEKEQAEADYEVARANYRQAVLDATAGLASARQKKAALETAQQRLKETKVYAPAAPAGAGSANGESLDYAVCQRSVSPGEMVWSMPSFPGTTGTSSTLFRLIIDRSLKLQAAIPDRHRGEVRVGQEVFLEVESYPGERFVGRLARVNPAVDRASRTFQIEVQIDNADRRLSAGSFAKAAIQTRVDQNARVVPEECVVSFAGVTKVFVDRSGRAAAVPVRVGAAVPLKEASGSRTWVEVDGDLPDGTSIVTSGQSQLAEGTLLRVRAAQATERENAK